MPGSRRRLPQLAIGILLTGVSTSTPGLAQINSYGSGLYSSETLSTPPDRRHGGYWESTSQHQRRPDGERATAPARSSAPRTSQNASSR